MIRQIALVIDNYFKEEDSPYNLAIFRIIFFLFVLIDLPREKVIWWSQLPADLRCPTAGIKTLASVVPITPDLVSNVMIFFIGFSFLAMVGCFARAASFLAAISGAYVLGVSTLYGRMNEIDHLIWFMLILSASKCSDVLSIDSIWKAFREADQGRVAKIEKSVEYALPLRFIWLLMGMIYFFPGFWKSHVSGGYWLWSDNIKYQMYAKWFTLQWLPSFRIDQHPLLCKLCGLGVVSFELSFVFLIFFPSLRIIPAILGLIFHNMTNFFMKISFFCMQICYVSFVNWEGLFAKTGEWIFKGPFYVRLEGRPGSYRRKIAVLTKFDIFQRVILLDQVQRFEKRPTDQRILKFAGISLLLINSIFGLGKIEGWPFSCYPTFSSKIIEAKIQNITPYGVLKNREEVISLDILREDMMPYKYRGIINDILLTQDKDQQRIKLKALVSVMKAEGIDLRNYSKVRFYSTIYSTKPEDAKDPPISRKVLAEIDI